MKLESIIEEFITTYPSMSLRPSSSQHYVVEGEFRVVAQNGDDAATYVDRTFSLRILIPISYPDSLPIIYENENRALIPTNQIFHKNKDSSLCLGSPEELLSQLSSNPSLVAYTRECVVPYLASAILLKDKQIPFPQGELEHGSEGLEQDFEARYGLKLNLETIVRVFDLLGAKKRKANKRLCPCGKLKLGKCGCQIRRFILSERKKKSHSRRFYRNVVKELLRRR